MKSPVIKRRSRDPWPKPGDARWKRDLNELIAFMNTEYARAWLVIACNQQPIAWETSMSREQADALRSLRVIEWAPCLATDGLTEREMNIFLNIARGFPVSEIARGKYLSVKTVSTYRARIIEKTGLRTNAEFTAYAMRHGLVTFPRLPVVPPSPPNAQPLPLSATASSPAPPDSGREPAFFGER